MGPSVEHTLACITRKMCLLQFCLHAQTRLIALALPDAVLQLQHGHLNLMYQRRHFLLCIRQSCVEHPTLSIAVFGDTVRCWGVRHRRFCCLRLQLLMSIPYSSCRHTLSRALPRERLHRGATLQLVPLQVQEGNLVLQCLVFVLQCLVFFILQGLVFCRLFLHLCVTPLQVFDPLFLAGRGGPCSFQLQFECLHLAVMRLQPLAALRHDAGADGRTKRWRPEFLAEQREVRVQRCRGLDRRRLYLSHSGGNTIKDQDTGGTKKIDCLSKAHPSHPVRAGAETGRTRVGTAGVGKAEMAVPGR